MQLRAVVARLVLDGDAGHVGALQSPAHRLGLVAVETGKPRAKQLLVALGDDRLGKRIGPAEQAVGLGARSFDTLMRFAFAVERADLNDLAGAGGDRRDRAVLLDGLRLRRGRRRIG